MNNHEMSASQVAEVLSTFWTWHEKTLAKNKNVLQVLLKAKSDLSSIDDARISQSEVETRYMREVNSIRTEIEHLQEDALAHLMGHYCVTDPCFKAKVESLCGKDPNESASLTKLSKRKLDHYGAIADLTGDFLKKVGPAN